MNKFYITTPIYYVNDVPHIGHAYTTIAADVLARYYKTQGKDVFFLTGTDEHGAKIADAAKKAGKEPKEFVDSLVPKFQSTWKNLNIEYSEFFRTTNPEHEKEVQEFVEKLDTGGYIEKRKYEGLYCTPCERFYKKEELVDGKCPIHKIPPELKVEENYFFLLSKLQDKLLKKIEGGELEIAPEARRNEIISKIKMGLEDVSISRQGVSWGIKFPGDETQTIYVWVDALLNYYTATKIFQKDIWPADLHLMAKDILWFHAIIWPSILLAAGLELPKKIFAHGFFTVDGEKMSKTTGNVLDPNKLVEKFGADAVRYALLREFPFGEDGDISEEKIAKRYEKDLSNGLGNLLQRTLSMINKFNTKIVIKPKTPPSFNGRDRAVINNIEVLKFDEALLHIWKIIAEQNQNINEEKPWDLAKNDLLHLEVVLQMIIDQLLIIAELLYPFMPETSKKIEDQIKNLKPEPLFPKLETYH